MPTSRDPRSAVLPTSLSAAVQVRGLTKRYGARTAVDSLDLELPHGVVAGFVGPNGSGKTTTMAMLLGLVRPSAGTGTVLGEPIEHPERYLRRVGALIETPAFYPSLTGQENLHLFATAGRHDPTPIEELLDVVGLAGRGDDRVRSYSLGMKQRLGIGAALLGEPELLVLDEPTNGLDPQGVREMRALVGSLAGAGRTVLVSSHDLSELEQVCDWLLLIDTGAVLYQGPTRALLDGDRGALVVVPESRHAIPVLRDALRARRFVVDERDGELVVHVPDAAGDDAPDASPLAFGAAVNRASFDAGVTIAELRPLRITLEDRFLDMTRGERP
jgi:ABC-2 type transport system ATP-binding protein